MDYDRPFTVSRVAPPPAAWQPIDVRGKLPTRAGAAPYGRRSLAGITGVDIHYTASPPVTVYATAAYQVGANAQEDFPAIAYTMFVEASGASYLCHDLTTRSWHSGAPGANTTRLSVCWAGNTTPNDAQLDGMAHCVCWLQDQLGRPLDIRGHKDAPYPTTCPGPTWNVWQPRLTTAIEALGG